MGYGMFYFGPALHIWISRILPRMVPVTGARSVIKRVAVDQVFFTPFAISSFFVVNTLLRGSNFDAAVSNLKTNWFSVLQSNWCYWPWVQFINFGLVPVHYQVLTASCASMFWNIYLSYCQNRAHFYD